MIYKTGYEWCLEAMIRILDLNDWEGSELVPDYEESYFREKITYDDFLGRLKGCLVKSNSIPRKTEKYLEYRMYFLVNYQFSGTIHAGIQPIHAAIDYGELAKTYVMTDDNGDELYKVDRAFTSWARTDKTVIVLNGGTTNNNPDRLGTLNQAMNTLKGLGIKLAPFYEPDINDALTAFAFLVDERVYEKELYEDFIPETLPWSRHKPSEQKLLELAARNEENYERWEDKIGGPKNSFLRNYLKPLRLA
jgi:hypothetical protein